MGMDVIGKNPKNKKGEYFRNNVWYWRPLATFICDTYPELAEQCEYWGSNDGDGLDEKNSLLLAKAIRLDLANGNITKFENEYNAWRSELPRENCSLCEATGIRRDNVGQENGMPDKELAEEVKILVGREFGWCNSCDGVGTTENWNAGYPFSIDNVKEFAKFLENCGGFEIW